MSEYAEIRERLYRPPNAVVDRPIALRGAARGISGYEATQKAAQRAAEREEKALAEKLDHDRAVALAMAFPPEEPNLPPLNIEHPPTAREIQKELCRQWPIALVHILSERRAREIVLPRHVAIALTKRLTLLSLPAIGRWFGNREHTTILHSTRKMAPIIEYVDATIAPDASLADWVSAAIAASKIIPHARWDHGRQ